MDERKELNPETVPAEIVPELVEVKKEVSNPKGAGRLPIEEDMALQTEYFHIYNLHTIGGLKTAQIAKVEGISESKVDKALAWVRRNWKILSQKEYWIDAENTVNERIRELSIMIAEAKRGDIVLNRNKEPVRVNGEIIRRTHKLYLASLIRERKNYEDSRNEIRGVISRHGLIVANTAVIGDVTLNIQNKVDFINQMEPADQEIMWKLVEKYAKPPD